MFNTQCEFLDLKISYALLWSYFVTAPATEIKVYWKGTVAEEIDLKMIRSDKVIMEYH